MTGTEQTPPKRRRSYALSDALEAFVGEVVPLVVPEMSSHWKRRILVLWDQEQQAFSDKTPSTQKLYTSKFRKALREGLERAEADPDRRKQVAAKLMEIIRQDPEAVEGINAQYRRRVAERHNNISIIPHWKGLVEEFRLLLNHSDARVKAIALMALTGRRFIEIVRVGSLSPLIEIVGHGRITKSKAHVRVTGGEIIICMPEHTRKEGVPRHLRRAEHLVRHFRVEGAQHLEGQVLRLRPARGDLTPIAQNLVQGAVQRTVQQPRLHTLPLPALNAPTQPDKRRHNLRRRREDRYAVGLSSAGPIRTTRLGLTAERNRISLRDPAMTNNLNQRR
ncbi:hypothetical protein FDP22_22735 (plasmid) [Paroceanicella profunda]|uniref:Telomere resolvase ResT/TelK catalytic domain-containing protein n=1 Tax=Paroceanicella profunda TaxID=2579971 RepID=A0A5B8G2G0_9RHOB|nr:protelomerase family protein [Paroceanicella profunda]QDL94795.1 hypothetical protein FDP22_22735 [Paroceanicella profunda]